MMVIVAGVGCARHAATAVTNAVPTGDAPSLVVGAFADDYGSAYLISRTEWRQDTQTRYRIVEWHTDSQFVIAQNAPTNASDANQWTRIDWIPLPGNAPYTWGYCLSAYNAPTKLAARNTHIAQPASPRTGCNGFPFSRMKPTAGSNTSHSTSGKDIL